MINQFFIGILVGFVLMGFITFIFPLQLIGVQQELVKQKHGYYKSTNGRFTLYDRCENNALSNTTN